MKVVGGPSGCMGSYELLEFVGDSLIGFIITEWLFNEFMEAREGPLTMAKGLLVSNAFMAAKMMRKYVNNITIHYTTG